MNDFPRRHRVDLWTPAEAKISDAIDFVERAGCDPRLTDAVVLLGRAKDKVADFVDGVPRVEEKPLHPVGVSVLLTRVNPDGITELLLAKRKNNSAAGLLSTPGGRLETNENILECAMREFYEETGCSIFFEQLEILGWAEHFRYGNHYIMFYVHATNYIGADSRTAGAIENRIPEKSEDWKFYTLYTLKLEETTEPAHILTKLRNKLFIKEGG